MDHSYFNTLSQFWNRIEKLDIELPEMLVKEIETIFSNLNIHLIAFKKSIGEFHRLTINSALPDHETGKRIEEVKWILPRDPKTVNEFGRMNLKEQTVFYGSFILPTLINEVKPKNGDLVTVSSWNLKDRDSEILVFPTFNPKKPDPNFSSAINVFNNHLNSYHEYIKTVIIAQQELFSKIFSKKIEFKNNYVFSASIANNILNKAYDGKIEAIIYPSVQDTSNINNIAFKPSVVIEKYQLSSIREYRVVDNINNTKVLEQTGVAQGIKSGIIHWH